METDKEGTAKDTSWEPWPESICIEVIEVTGRVRAGVCAKYSSISRCLKARSSKPMPPTLWPGKAALACPISCKERESAWVQGVEARVGSQHLPSRWRILGCPEWVPGSRCILSSLRSKSECDPAFELAKQMQESRDGGRD